MKMVRVAGVHGGAIVAIDATTARAAAVTARARRHAALACLLHLVRISRAIVAQLVPHTRTSFRSSASS
jgi:hypothetical protein